MTKIKMAGQFMVYALLMIGWFMFATAPAYASGDDDCRRGHEQCGHNNGDGDDGQAQSQSEATATAESTATADATSYSEGGSGGDGGEGGAGGSANSSATGGAAEATGGNAEAEGGNAEAVGGSVGDITVNNGDNIPADTTHKADIRIENTPDSVTITPGSGDSCKAHIGGNLSLPGLGTGLTIPLPGKECRKLKYYDRMIAMGDNNAAEIIFCSLKEIDREFRELGLPCRDTLSIYIVPPPEDLIGQVTLSASEYDNLLVAQVQQEEFEDAVEQGKARYAQQQSLIDALQEEVEGFESEADEIERLKREAASLRAAQEQRIREEAEVKAKFKERLAKKGDTDGR